MGCIIIVMPKIEDGKKIGGLLTKRGYPPDLICQNAADALSESCRRDDGVIICSGHLADMSYVELHDCIPKQFKIIIITRNVMSVEYPEDSIKVEIPFKVSDLIGHIESEFAKYYHRPTDNKIVKRERSNEERKYIDKAKAILMEKNSMTEPEAYRYLQKHSMDTGSSLVETAQMIIILNNE